ncbi:MAG: type II toxin-antitoxin system prevent-host-death family antitoxin [Nitrospinae bacterium]|nr:type II toxin-antitoxin system prevent-host-death family antitoxin [Nitrospinota bacterium]
MARIAASVLREVLADTVNRVAYGKERIVLQKRGKDVAALVPMQDMDLLEKLEDLADFDEAEKALAEMKSKGEKPIPWAKAKQRLGLGK